MEPSEKFCEYAKLELFGHQQLAGRVSEQTIAGTGFIRIDVPAVGEAPEFTRFFGPSAVYSITPVSKDVATRLVTAYRSEPISRYEMPSLPAPQATGEDKRIQVPGGDGDRLDDQYDEEEEDDSHEEFQP